MNGLSGALGEVSALIRALKVRPAGPDVLVCPPATLISRVAARAGGVVAVGGQDCHPQPSGAFTGDVSAEMLRDAGLAAHWDIDYPVTRVTLTLGSERPGWAPPRRRAD